MPQTTEHVHSMDEFLKELRHHKLRATRQRIAVHEVMMELGHASADTVCAALKEKDSGVTTSSVYNILSQLADLHIYGRRLSAANKMFFDVDTDRHIHLYDRENHIFKDIADEELSALVASHLKRRRFRGYTVEEIDIQLIARPTHRGKNSL